MTIAGSADVEQTDGLQAGALIHHDTGSLNRLFTDIDAIANDHALRGSWGMGYEMTDTTLNT